MESAETTGDLRNTLSRIWAQVLGRDEVGLDDHFLDLGGNSISNVLISGRAQEAGIPVTPKMLFDNPTVRMLSDAVLAANGGRVEVSGADQLARESPVEAAATRYPMSGLDQEQLDALLTGILGEKGDRR